MDGAQWQEARTQEAAEVFFQSNMLLNILLMNTGQLFYLI